MPIVPVVDVWTGRAASACRFAFIAVAFFLGTVFFGQWCGCGKAHGAEVSYYNVEHCVSAGESLVVYAGVTMPTHAEANAVRVDAIPGEPKGVYDCFRKDGEAVMVMRVVQPRSAPPVIIPTVAPVITRPRRVVIAGKYYDQYADGHLVACST